MRLTVLFALGVVTAAVRWVYLPPPAWEQDPVFALLRLEAPRLYWIEMAWYGLSPLVAVMLCGSVVWSAWVVWGPQGGGRERLGGPLPPWPAAPEDAPCLVLGEVHHGIEDRETARPQWMVIPGRGLVTGTAIFGAVGSGKTASLMYPAAEQLFGWRASDPERKLSGLILEVKGDFCYEVRKILKAAGREEDYLEISLDGDVSWNPLATPEMDSYSVAYQLASILNQLYGKGGDPFWQQSYTNTLRNLISLHRIPGVKAGNVTLRDLYRCAISPALLQQRLDEARALAEDAGSMRVAVLETALQVLTGRDEHGILDWDWREESDGWISVGVDRDQVEALAAAGLEFRDCTDDLSPARGAESAAVAELLAPIQRWYAEEWMALDVKLRTSIVAGISVFLGMFDEERLARVFCPGSEDEGASSAGLPTRRPLPPLSEIIETGKVLCLNLPAGTNAALARTIGTMLKTAFLQAMQVRPSLMSAPENAGRYWRRSVLMIDEYQAFATVGQNDPNGDEKAFAVTRQAGLVAIVATQSVSSLKSSTGGSEAWRTLLQTLRTQIYLTSSDTVTQKHASEACGDMQVYRASVTIGESAGKAGVSLFTGSASGAKGSVSTSKSYSEQRQATFPPVVFARLPSWQAIVLPFDGSDQGRPSRVYLKPYFLPRELGYFEARRTGRL